MNNIIVFTLLVLLSSSLAIQSSAFAMTWSATWDDILSGGSKRWIVDNVEHKEAALNHILAHTESSDDEPLQILCPLAGDDMFAHYAWTQGHSVTAIDLVPAAVQAMRARFGPDEDHWTKEEQPNKMVVWKHKSERATLYQGDAFTELAELKSKIDVVYDKDSFGAVDKHMRQKLCERLADYTKEGATVYIEVKFRDEKSNQGPPFHVEKEDLMEKTSFGSAFEHVKSLGAVYPLKMPGMSQMGHILRRLPK